MKIIVPIKQVPGTTQVNIDPETGTLMRAGVDSKMNPYDLFALEAALQLKASLGARVCVLSMGPPQAEEILREAYMMGADTCFLVSDRRFAGADVLATSYTLAQAMRALGGCDLIICGKQTTDGDTAQVGPAMAEHLGIPHVAWVTRIEQADAQGLTVTQDIADCVQRNRVPFPCLITVEKDLNQPRLLSYRLKKATADWPVERLSFDDLGGDPARYGLDGSPTKVEKVFPPEQAGERELWQGEAPELARRLCGYLRERRILDI